MESQKVENLWKGRCDMWKNKYLIFLVVSSMFISASSFSLTSLDFVAQEESETSVIISDNKLTTATGKFNHGRNKKLISGMKESSLKLARNLKSEKSTATPKSEKSITTTASTKSEKSIKITASPKSEKSKSEKSKKESKKSKLPKSNKNKSQKKSKKNKTSSPTNLSTRSPTITPAFLLQDATSSPGVVIESNGALAAFPVENLIDDVTSTDFVSTSSKPLVTVTFPNNRKFFIQKYSINPSESNVYPDPQGWVFQGSNDGINWSKLHEIQKFKKNKKTTWDLKTPDLYNQYRFKFTTKNQNNVAGTMALSEIKLLGSEQFSFGKIFIDELQWPCDLTEVLTEENTPLFEEQVLTYLNFAASCNVDSQFQLEYFEFTVDLGSLEIVDPSRRLQTSNRGNASGQCRPATNQCPFPSVGRDTRYAGINTRRTTANKKKIFQTDLSCEEFNNLENPVGEFVDIFGNCGIERVATLQAIFFELPTTAPPTYYSTVPVSSPTTSKTRHPTTDYAGDYDYDYFPTKEPKF